MKVALIITTYNSVLPLKLCLKSVLEQSFLPDEIIIADDGSTDETKRLVENFKQQNHHLNIFYVWQEDKGFRAAKSRNNAAKISKSEYLIYIDGDIILHKNFVKDHVKNAKLNTYLQGSRVILKESFTKQIFEKQIFEKPCLFSSNTKNNLNGYYNIFLSFIISKFSKNTQKGIRSCNFSFFKSDFLKVNGFNEDFIAWGREDSEFIARLYNAGINRKNLKFAGIQYHLYHNEGSSSSKNDALLQKTIDEKLTWCENGINQ